MTGSTKAIRYGIIVAVYINNNMSTTYHVFLKGESRDISPFGIKTFPLCSLTEFYLRCISLSTSSYIPSSSMSAVVPNRFISIRNLSMILFVRIFNIARCQTSLYLESITGAFLCII